MKQRKYKSLVSKIKLLFLLTSIFIIAVGIIGVLCVFHRATLFIVCEAFFGISLIIGYWTLWRIDVLKDKSEKLLAEDKGKINYYIPQKFYSNREFDNYIIDKKYSEKGSRVKDHTKIERQVLVQFICYLLGICTLIYSIIRESTNFSPKCQCTCYCESNSAENKDTKHLALIAESIKDNTVYLDSIKSALNKIATNSSIHNIKCDTVIYILHNDTANFNTITDAIRNNTSHLDTINSTIKESIIARIKSESDTSLFGYISIVVLIFISIVGIIYILTRSWEVWQKILLMLMIGGLTLFDSVALKLADTLNFKIADTIQINPTISIYDTAHVSTQMRFQKIATLSNFKDADTALSNNSNIISFIDSIENVCSMANNDSLVSVWIIGNVDKRHLRNQSLNKYGSNTNLAMLRAQAVKNILINKAGNEKRKALESKIILLPSGAQYIGVKVDSLLMAQDRSVSVYVLSYSKKIVKNYPINIE
jgi:hypothetical protein